MPTGIPGTGYWSSTGWVEGPAPETYQNEVEKTLQGTGVSIQGGAPPLTQEQADILNAPFQLAGMDPNASPSEPYTPAKAGDPNYFYRGGSGYSPAELAKMNEERRILNNRNDQFSQNNSFSFDPETIAGIKKASDSFQLSLNEITNNMPWSSQGTKNDSIKNLIGGSLDLFAKPFGTTEEFQRAYQTNPEVQKFLDPFVKAGGSVNDILLKIQKKNRASVPEGWDAETYANFKKANPDLEPNAEDTARMNGTAQMTTADYLTSLNDGTPAGLAAEKALFPERELAQQEIARQTGMTEDLIKFYFGDEKQIGFLQQKKNIAEESLRTIEAKIQNATATAEAKANFQIDKNNSEVEIAKATIEENRLNAKNYMTGMLAKLGALKTTGAAPKAIALLDQKYQRQKQELESKLDFTNQQIRINLQKETNDILTAGEEKITAIREDLSKDSETIFKEVTKVKNDMDAKIFQIASSYAKSFGNEKEKYEKEAKSASEKYIKEFARLAGKGYDTGAINEIISGKKVDPMDASGRYANINSLPEEVQNDVVQSIISGLTLSELRSRFSNVATAVLNNIWNQMTSKNTGAPVKPPVPIDQAKPEKKAKKSEREI